MVARLSPFLLGEKTFFHWQIDRFRISLQFQATRPLFFVRFFHSDFWEKKIRYCFCVVFHDCLFLSICSLFFRFHNFNPMKRKERTCPIRIHPCQILPKGCLLGFCLWSQAVMQQGLDFKIELPCADMVWCQRWNEIRRPFTMWGDVCLAGTPLSIGSGLKHLFFFTPTWGYDPIWLICCKRGWNSQKKTMLSNFGPGSLHGVLNIKGLQSFCQNWESS